MSPDKLVYQADQIATFFRSKPHEDGVTVVAEHINKFREPRMGMQFFGMIDEAGAGFNPLVLEAAAKVRRPAEAASA